MDIEAYFERIGYKNSGNKPDLETLTDIFEHHIRAIPLENLNLHCGKSLEFGLEATFDKLVRKNQGGLCIHNNHLLYWALTTIGFETTMLGSYIYIIQAKKYSNSMIHPLLMVAIDGKNYIVDAGLGRFCQIWQPLELISGKDQPQVPSIFRLTEEGEYWYLDQIRREQHTANQEFLHSDLLDKNTYRKIYSFTLTPRTIDDFKFVLEFYLTSETSVFKKNSFCSLQTPDGVYCLLGFTLIYRKFNYKDNMDLVEFKMLNEEEIEKEMKNIFGISLEGKLVPKHDDQFLDI
ncbi:arylamine N-acetyltransferase 1-like [Pteropus vampyrus]|uniref:Arylamine N-acetyltransferase 1 n=1 Tax=Pteropus vampyrus TaxID=132908 RepID=A0A6P6C5R1_PTEVA|nr:arylamine N-acetyltransferase 1-like [Pteropus vampyrus]XP_023382711.1 arylamine N-acetyltransferase 1-like [Pteropus vampyrus]